MLLKSQRERPGKFNTGAVLDQLSHQVNWEQVVMLSDYLQAVDLEIDDENTGMR